MCYGWYTRRDIIRTIRRRIIREICERETLVSFTVIDNDLQMIIIDINCIDKGFDNVPAKQGIIPVAFGELLQKEYHTVLIKQLGL